MKISNLCQKVATSSGESLSSKHKRHMFGGGRHCHQHIIRVWIPWRHGYSFESPLYGIYNELKKMITLPVIPKTRKILTGLKFYDPPTQINAESKVTKNI